MKGWVPSSDWRPWRDTDCSHNTAFPVNLVDRRCSCFNELKQRRSNLPVHHKKKKSPHPLEGCVPRNSSLATLLSGWTMQGLSNTLVLCFPFASFPWLPVCDKGISKNRWGEHVKLSVVSALTSTSFTELKKSPSISQRTFVSRLIRQLRHPFHLFSSSLWVPASWFHAWCHHDVQHALWIRFRWMAVTLPSS